MKPKVLAMAASCVVLCECSNAGEKAQQSALASKQEKAEQGRQALIDELVNRFDAQPCAAAAPIGTMRKTTPDKGAQLVRAYSVDDACIDAIKAGMVANGFDEDEPGAFRLESDSGSKEAVTIEREESEPKGGIQWETIEP
ncbi:MAG: hypothetical protein AAFW59_04505 [Pseudomonadota bacterium]